MCIQRTIIIEMVIVNIMLEKQLVKFVIITTKNFQDERQTEVEHTNTP